jgi:hypothetical protein
MQQRFEYEFVRELDYRQIVQRYAREGWRVVTIFPLGKHETSPLGAFEILFERPVTASSESQSGA